MNHSVKEAKLIIKVMNRD